MLVEDVIKIEYVVEYCLIFFLAFIGSFTNDYLNLFHYRIEKLSFIRTTLSAIFASLLVFAFSAYIQEHSGGVRGLMVWSFLIGLSGFQLLEKASSLDKLINLLEKLSKLDGLINLLKTIINIYDKKDKD